MPESEPELDATLNPTPVSKPMIGTETSPPLLKLALAPPAARNDCDPALKSGAVIASARVAGP
ncbi:MAG: hypothetical protein ACYTHK_06855 [Planctomycetota bacterium]